MCCAQSTSSAQDVQETQESDSSSGYKSAVQHTLLSFLHSGQPVLLGRQHCLGKACRGQPKMHPKYDMMCFAANFGTATKFCCASQHGCNELRAACYSPSHFLKICFDMAIPMILTGDTNDEARGHLQHVAEVCNVGPRVLQEGKLVACRLQISLQGGHCRNAGRQVGAQFGQVLLCCRLRGLQARPSAHQLASLGFCVL